MNSGSLTLEICSKDYTTHRRRRRKVKERRRERGKNVESILKGLICQFCAPTPLSATAEPWVDCISLRQFLFHLKLWQGYIIWTCKSKLFSIFFYPQNSIFKKALWYLAKIDTVVWEGTVLSAERQGKQNVPAWTFANGTTNLCVDLMENSMQTTVKCTELLAWRNKRSPLFTMKTASSKVNAGWT